MALLSVREDIDETYARAHLGEFAPTLDVAAAFGRLNLYSGAEEVREFDLAGRLHLVGAGHTIHKLRRDETATRIEADLSRSTLTIATFNSRRDLGSAKTPPAEMVRLPYAFRANAKTAGFVPNSLTYDIDGWIAVNQQAIDLALAEGADIVSFGEFDFPSIAFDDAATRSEALVKLKAHEGWICTRAEREQRPVLICCGTAHRWAETFASCENVGRIAICEREAGSGAYKCQVVDHHKRTSAKSLGEVLQTYARPELSFYSTSFGNIGVLICIDAFDPGIVTSVFANSRDNNQDRLTCILVPAYNPSRSLVRSCQQLSYLSNCVVVYVNAWSGSRHQAAQVFMSGVPFGVWADQLGRLRELINSRNSRALLDESILSSIPGLGDFTRLSALADVARGMKRVPVASPAGSLGGGELILWHIPAALQIRAAETMRQKLPYNRSRLIKSLQKYIESLEQR